MCIITMTALGTALGMSASAISAASAASAAGMSALGVATGVANAALAIGTIGSAVMGITSSAVQGRNQQAMYNYQAQINENNAKIANNNASLERQSGLEEARLQRIKTLQNIGSQQVAMAGNGIDITSGTALDTIEDTAQFGELDALMTQYNAERTALNYEQQASNFNNQANLDRIASQNAGTAGRINTITAGFNGLSNIASMGVGSGLGNIGKVSSKWTRFSKMASGSKVGQQGSKLYAGLSSGLI